MPRRHVAILVLVAIALTVTSLALSRRDSRDWRANRSRRLFPFPWQDAASVRIDRPGRDTLSFTRPTGGEWQIELGDGLADSLDPTAVQALEALVTMSWREPLRDRPAPNPDRAVAITAGNASGLKVVIRLGDAMQNLRAATVDADDSVVYGVNQDLLAFLDWPDSRFRNLNLATGPNNAKPDRITLTPGAAPDLSVTLERTPDGWRQTVPVNWPVDETRLDLLLRWIDRSVANPSRRNRPATLPGSALRTNRPGSNFHTTPRPARSAAASNSENLSVTAPCMPGTRPGIPSSPFRGTPWRKFPWTSPASTPPCGQTSTAAEGLIFSAPPSRRR